MINSLHARYFFLLFCHLQMFFSKLTFSFKNSETPECQTVWNQIWPHIVLGLIWIQTVCKGYHSTLDKQRICVNTHLKSSKKQLKWNVCVPKSSSNDRYAITCDVIAYHLVHFVSIWVINKCQSGNDFFLPASAQYNSSIMKISVPSPVFRRKTLWWKWNFCKVYTLECQQGDEICFRYNKIR